MCIMMSALASQTYAKGYATERGGADACLAPNSSAPIIYHTSPQPFFEVNSTGTFKPLVNTQGETANNNVKCEFIIQSHPPNT